METAYAYSDLYLVWLSRKLDGDLEDICKSSQRNNPLEDETTHDRSDHHAHGFHSHSLLFDLQCLLSLRLFRARFD